MREVSNFIRQAYLNVLTPLVVDGVTIPFFDEIVNPNATIPTFKGAECYILFTGQNEVETTNNRDSFRESVAVTLQIIAEYPLGSGGKLAVETISDSILQQIRLINDPVFNLGSPFQVLRTKKESGQTIISNGKNHTTYQKNLNISHVVYQDPDGVDPIAFNTLESLLDFTI